jgi:uncharacterized membrane protein YedE/YeeE
MKRRDLMFETGTKLILGLITGIVFGFLLQKGRVAKFPVIVGQFVLKDWTVVKIMSVAVVIGSIGVYLLHQLNMINLEIKPFQIGGIVIGGLLFGIGITILGYCPGTTVVACGEGHRDALVGVIGMLSGAAIFVSLYSQFQMLMKSLGDMGKITFPQITATSPWMWIIGIAIATSVAMLLLERKYK